MNGAAEFDSTKKQLHQSLKDIAEGKIQLPDFQRGWVWDDHRIRSLLGSVAKSYPIGTLMMLEAGNQEVRLRPRPIEGVALNGAVQPELFILDGQQRLTALYQALCSGAPVETRDEKGKPVKRWYYIDIAKALDDRVDKEEAIVGLPEDRIIRGFGGEIVLDVSTPEVEYEKGLFPLSKVFDCAEWRWAYAEYWNHHPEKTRQFDRFDREVIKRFEQYWVPVITLSRQTPKEAVCQVFEKVNTGGVPLTVFELLTAIYAAEDFSLRADWEKRRKEMSREPVLRTVEATDFLQAVTLVATYRAREAQLSQGMDPRAARPVSCKRGDILDLPLRTYQESADAVTEGFLKAARLLFSQKISRTKDLPYRTQLVPLAAILTVLGPEADLDGVKAKIVRWYWCGVLGELYGGALESRFARDLPEVVEWVRGGAEPSTVRDANFMPERLLTLRTRNSAAYKGLYVLLLREGALDFQSGELIADRAYYDDTIDIHHIFPRRWCDEQGIDPQRCESIVNKTALSSRTNREIGGTAPSIYLPRLEKKAGITPPRMDEILRSHLIEPSAIRQDDFDAFYRARESALLRYIERVMGKPVAASPEPAA
ncbi:GmrSD restriction endonuclease domain-containing protein [Geochorda subterranea]|uniref:DUF262 domain-containing protein n=1 Tax=Geochorda subterranea TaxID=3109564 RepID=A0ABZ1BLL7_9FIRM|nr:DUF262 domain-containing protein [Limnochorda sp. LNt]WRP13722.1 DUF262 domain-containing protein [Limnochorda sp. LNt]